MYRGYRERAQRAAVRAKRAVRTVLKLIGNLLENNQNLLENLLGKQLVDLLENPCSLEF